jgi:hypothetical protein
VRAIWLRGNAPGYTRGSETAHILKVLEESRKPDRVNTDMSETSPAVPIHATAFHEAGHAVEAFYLHVPFSYATIETTSILDRQGQIIDPKGRLGHVLFHNRPNWTDRDSPAYLETRAHRWFENQVQIYFAGKIAETKVLGQSVERAFGDDEASADIALSLSGGFEDEASAWLHWLFLKTQNHLSLDHVWHAVEVLAQALLQLQTIRYRAARQIIETTLWEP